MNDASLLALLRGDLSIEEFLRAERRYIFKMANYFGRRAPSNAQHLEFSDFENLARAALWEAASAYVFRCPTCPRDYRAELDFAAHVARAHGEALDPKPTIFPYVHGRVGRVLYREVRKSRRRMKFYGVGKESMIEVGTPATQLDYMIVSQTIEQAAIALGISREGVLNSIEPAKRKKVAK